MTALDPELFLPEPERREVRCTVISVDDHVVEPAHLFATYLPTSLQPAGPHIVEADNGAQVWEFEGNVYSQVGMNAVAGRRPESVTLEPFRFEHMRPGCYDVDARVADMDTGGIWAMLNFPSMITGFCGRVFSFAKDAEVGKAATRAWNDWLYHEWYLAHPERSSGGYPIPAGAPWQLSSAMFGQLSLAACNEWLWSGFPLDYPELKLAMSEGGIGWVPMLIDRLDNMVDRSGYGRGWDIRPADVLRRNFWFCTIDDPSTIALRHVIGVGHIMLETDYPHGDGTWPDTQAVIARYWGDIPAAELRRMCSVNAAELYRHPLPDVVLPL